MWIKTTKDILETYFDEAENMIYQDQFLEEITQGQLAAINKNNSEDPMVKILEQLVGGQRKKNKVLRN